MAYLQGKNLAVTFFFLTFAPDKNNNNSKNQKILPIETKFTS